MDLLPDLQVERHPMQHTTSLHVQTTNELVCPMSIDVQSVVVLNDGCLFPLQY